MRLSRLLLAGCVLLPGPLAAQDGDALRARLGITTVPVTREGGTSPAVSISTPTGYGADGGLAFAGVGFQERTRYTNVRDAAAVVGFGVGDSRRLLGLEVAATTYSLGRRHAPGKVGSVTFKLHRLLPADFAVAAGVENVAHWGDTDAGRSPYAALSRLFVLNDDPRRRFGALVLSAGVGGGRFRSEDDVQAQRHRASPFGSAALFIAEPVTVVADWTGQDLAVGTSFLPFQHVPLVFTPALADLTRRAGDGPRFILGVGYGLRYRTPF
ncbi:MAG: putative S-layer protein [Gemmatimonadetes bacterium]|nr:putative S-layer protein [Gemmatimonadota bacterium]